MNSEKNRRTLSLGGGKYILATKMRGGGEVTDEVLTRGGRFHEVPQEPACQRGNGLEMAKRDGATWYASIKRKPGAKTNIAKNYLSSSMLS